jgi:ATP-dependent RNA helicase RhlE
MLFSATMPREIVALADSLLTDPVRVAVSTVASAAPKIEQSVYMVGRQQKQALLHHLIDEHEITRTLVFTRTKHGADKVARRLNRAGIAADAIHGNKSQNQRQRALDGFRRGKCRVLVATDVAARGLDIDDVSHVFNFDLPVEPEAYVHRIGRTGRAGAAGAAIAFCDNEERSLLRGIERLTGKKIDAVKELPTLPKLAPADAEGADDQPRPAHRSPAPRPTHTGGHSTNKPRRAAGPNSRPRGGPGQTTRTGPATDGRQRQGRGAGKRAARPG